MKNIDSIRKPEIFAYIRNYLPSLILFIGIFGSIFNRYILFATMFTYGMLFVFALICFLLDKENPLRIETPDGSNEPYHPTVIYFSKAWRDYRYWMAYTPFPISAKPYPDRWECPCVMASHNGIDWSWPDKKRFIDDLMSSKLKTEVTFRIPI